LRANQPRTADEEPRHHHQQTKDKGTHDAIRCALSASRFAGVSIPIRQKSDMVLQLRVTIKRVIWVLERTCGLPFNSRTAATAKSASLSISIVILGWSDQNPEATKRLSVHCTYVVISTKPPPLLLHPIVVVHLVDLVVTIVLLLVDE